MLETKPLSITAIGLSNTDFSVLKVATSLLERHENMTVQLLEKEDYQGDIICIDLDNEGGRKFYQEYTYPRHQALLLLTNDSLSDQRNMVLRKPIRVQTLRNSLSDLYSGLFSKPTDKANHLEIAVSAEKVEITKSLFYALLTAKQQQQAYQIYCPPYSPLFVEGKVGMVATSANREMLRKITRGHNPQLRNTQLSNTDFDVLAKGQMIIPLNHLLWSTGLYGSYGQIIPNHSIEEPVRLKAWPNLSRLEFESDHMKLASVMTARAVSLKQIHEKIKVPWSTIIGFYNAAWATDLLITHPGQLPTYTATHKLPAKEGLFAKIANRLKIASS